MSALTVDADRLNDFLNRFVGDAGATMHATTVVVGDRLGLYKALAAGPATSVDLAKRTGLNERLLREWLRAQAASGYAEYDAASDQYALSAEQAFALADDDGLSLPGVFRIAHAVMHDAEANAQVKIDRLLQIARIDDRVHKSLEFPRGHFLSFVFDYGGAFPC